MPEPSGDPYRVMEAHLDAIESAFGPLRAELSRQLENARREDEYRARATATSPENEAMQRRVRAMVDALMAETNDALARTEALLDRMLDYWLGDD